MATTMDIKLVIAAVDKASKEINGVKNSLKGAGAEADRFKTKMKKAADKAKAAWGGIWSKVRIAGPLLIGGIAKVGTDYQQMMANLSTMTNKGFDDVIATYEDKFFELSKTTGTSLKEITDGAFDALSRQVPENKLAQFLTVANEAAIAGATDMKTIIAAVKPLLNAYKMGIGGAGTVTDKMFKAFEKGNFKIGEFADALGMVSDDAANAGISIDDLFGTFAGLTQQFGKGSASLVQTTISAFISSFTKQGGSALEQLNKDLQKAGKPMIEMSLKTIKEKGLPGAVSYLAEQLQNAGIQGTEFDKHLVKILGRKESIRFFLKMGNRMDAVKDATKAIATEAKGLRKANFDKQMKARTLKKFNAQMKILMIQLSKGLLPVLQEVVAVMGPYLESFGQWAKDNKETVGTIVKVTLGLGALTVAFITFKTILAAFFLANPLGLFLTSIAVVFASVTGKLDFLNKAIDGVIHKLLKAIGLQKGLTSEETGKKIEELDESEQKVLFTGAKQKGVLGAAMKAILKHGTGGVVEGQETFTSEGKMSKAQLQRMSLNQSKRRLQRLQEGRKDARKLTPIDVQNLVKSGVLKEGTTTENFTINQSIVVNSPAGTPQEIAKTVKKENETSMAEKRRNKKRLDKTIKRGSQRSD